MPDGENELSRLQSEAMARVMEMQKRARRTYETAQEPDGAPQQKPDSSERPGPDDPILAAALAYLFA